MRTFCGILLAALAAHNVWAGMGPNLVINHSFEDGEHSSVINGWVKWSDGDTSGQFTWDNYAGRKFGKAVSTYAARADNVSGRGGYMSDKAISVRDDHWYVLMGFLSGEGASGEVRLGIRWYGQEGFLGEVFGPAVSGSTGPNDGDWVVTAFKVRPPEGATGALILCRADFLAGSAWFEDIGFHDVGSARESVGWFRGLALGGVKAGWWGGAEDRYRKGFDGIEARVAGAIADLKRSGGFWQAAAIALERGRLLRRVGKRDIAAGWQRRGWEHLHEAVKLLLDAEELARKGATRPDPLPGGREGGMPLGVAIPLRYPAAPGAWDEMMSYAADFGFTEAAVDVPWALWEPEEGKRDFAMVDAIMDAAEKHGIRAFPVAGPRFSMTRGRAPDNKTSLMGPPAWYMARHPESALRSAAGESVRGCDGMFWEFAFVDPRNLKKVPAYLATWGASLDALSKQAGGRKGLGGWFLSNEPLMGQGPNDIRNLKKAALLGYNPEYREAFRAWLKQKYGTMEALRAEWGAAAPSAIAEITPPSASEIRASETAPGRRYRGQYARIRDWLLFRASALAGGLRWEGDRLSAGVAVPAVPKLYPFAVNGRLDPDGYAPDVAGEAFAGPVAMDLAADAIPFPLHTRLQDVAIGAARASGRPIWLTDYCLKRAELLGGEDRQDLLSAPYAEPYIMGAVLAGARGFFFRSLQNVPAQSSFAYTGRKGTKNVTLSDEGLAVAKTTQSLKVMAPWLAGASLAPPRYGLLVQWDTLLNDDPEGDHALAVLNVLALAGVHEVAVVTEEQLVRGRAAEFEVILTPYATRISRKAVGVLEKFVRNGGVLISDTYIGSKQANGKPRGVLPFGLGELFGLRPEKEGQASDAGNVGVVQAPAFTQFTKLMPFSISLYSGSWRVRARAGTEVLANYLGGKDGREIPAITVRKHGRGSAVVFPRVRHWPEHLREMAGRRLPRPELRGLLMGRTGLMMNGVVCAITMRRLLNRLGVLPAARLVRAPVSPRFLAEMAAWAKDAGIPADEIAHSEKLIRESQTGFPILKRIELVTLQRFWEVDMDEFAPVRVNMLAGADGGRVAAAINYSSMARVAELALPPCGALVDCLTGEEFAVKDGRTSLELGPYQARLLALLER